MINCFKPRTVFFAHFEVAEVYETCKISFDLLKFARSVFETIFPVSMMNSILKILIPITTLQILFPCSFEKVPIRPHEFAISLGDGLVPVA